MSVATEITRLQNAKASIKSSIEAKGVTVPSSTTLDGYSTLIDSIPSGGGTTINGDLVNKTIQSGTISKGDFVGIGDTTITSQITSDLRYYLNPNCQINLIERFYDDNYTNYASVATKSGVSSTNQYISIGLPTREQLNLPSGKKILDFSIEGKVSWGGLAFSSGINKSVYLSYYSTGELSSPMSLSSYTYTNDDASTFPKTFTFYKPNYIDVTTDDIGKYGVRYWHGTGSYLIELYYLNYSITYEDDGKIKTITGGSKSIGIANENGSQGDTIEVYIPSTE